MFVRFCASHYLVRVSANRSRNHHEFCHVEATFAYLEFRHEGLTLPDALPQFSLRNTRVLASLHKQLDHSQVEIGTK